jgi:hypothetical protein
MLWSDRSGRIIRGRLLHTNQTVQLSVSLRAYRILSTPEGRQSLLQMLHESNGAMKARERQITLLRCYGSRWGPGKVHGASNAKEGIPWCQDDGIHAERIKGFVGDITCKRCKK